MTVLLFGSAYTGMHTLLPLYMLFDRLNLVNTFTGIALVVAVQVLPVGVIALSSFLRRIPGEFREVAILNGMKEGSYLLRIILPLSLPLIVGIVIFAIVSAWNAFTVPLIFIDKMKMLPFSIKIYEYAGEIGSYYTKWNLFGAASIIGIIPLIFLYRRSQKFLYIRYLSEGGVNYE
jgi:ABC-type glycerol-3-phosphate transport system permease component